MVHFENRFSFFKIFLFPLILPDSAPKPQSIYFSFFFYNSIPPDPLSLIMQCAPGIEH